MTPPAAHRLLFINVMNLHTLASVALAASLLAVSCTGGQESEARTLRAEEAAQQAGAAVDAQAELHRLSPAIPVYAGAEYRADFTRRDEVVIRNQYGDESEVITLTTDNALPKVWHYYVTYLAQYRAWEPASSYPPENRQWRSLEVNLSEAMHDPFVPGSELKTTDRSVILQISETEGEPKTIIRYIITPEAPRLATTKESRAARES